ncbi:DUF4345 domain-containing protein [Rhizorhabdus argentea]|uniref:DUF4345 domain-containing protein n=1 Tax=Rhizorhabdus argentea TaxID=1387174 RepID=UPI0030EE906C
MTRERIFLQAAVSIACLVPILTGLDGVLRGAAMFRLVPVAPDLDSHFRYLSGIFLMLGLAFASTVPAIERKGARFRLLGAMVVTGGFARGLSWATVGMPGLGHRLGLGMELIVVPLLMLWQARVAHLSRSAAG